VLVFAEGTRSRKPSMLPFKKGGFHLAVDAQVPILPVAVNRSRRLLPKGAMIPRPGTIHVHVGEPIATQGLGKEHVDELLRRTRAAITEMRRLDPDFAEDDLHN
jgi:1-acyl-sn-glycerol-3-phosphate acyltransferase